MGDVVVRPWLLQVSLWVTLATACVLVAIIVTSRITRARRQRRRHRELEPLRGDMIELAAGDDEDGAAEQRLRQVPLRLLGLVDPYLVGMLSKVRGAPAERIAAVLAAHGTARRARDGLTSRSRTRRADSVWMLGLLRSREAVPGMIPLLQDRDRGVAVTAARALGLVGDHRAAGPLLEALPASRHGGLPVWVVVEALRALDPGAADRIGQGLSSPDPTVRTAAAEAVGEAQHVSQVGRLREMLRDEEDAYVLAAAAAAMGSVGSPADLPALLPLTTAEQPREVRLAAVRAVGEVGGRPARDALVSLLGDADPRVGELAAESLGSLGQAGRTALRDHAETGPGDDPSVLSARHGLAVLALRQARGVG